MAINYNDPNPDFGAGFSSKIFDQSYGGEGVWGDSRPYHQGQGWVEVGAGGDPAGYKRYVEANKSAYYSPYGQSSRMASNTSNRLAELLTDPNAIQKTPGYQFAVDQGNQAINRSAAAKGMLNSGSVLAELAKYGQGMASQEYGNQVNRLSGLLGQSQNFILGANAGPYQRSALNPMTQTPSYSSYTSWA